MGLVSRLLAPPGREDLVTRWTLAVLGVFLVDALAVGVVLYSMISPRVAAFPLFFFVLVPQLLAGALYAVALYRERQFLAERTGWTPNPGYFLGVLPNLWGFVVVAVYIYRRRTVPSPASGTTSGTAAGGASGIAGTGTADATGPSGATASDAGTPWKYLVVALVLVAVLALVVLAGTLPTLGTFLLDDGGPTASEDAPTTSTASGGGPATSTAPEDGASTSAEGTTPTITLPPTDRAPLLATAFESGLDGWQVTERADANGTGEGEVAVRDGQLQLRVRNCYRVAATRDLGRVDGPVRVSFEWETAADNWWERPDWRVVTADGTVLNYTVSAGRDLERPEQGGRKHGRVVATVAAATRVELQFRIRPSRFCERANHEDTYLRVDNVTVVEQGDG